jgi:hypothetical protein
VAASEIVAVGVAATLTEEKMVSEINEVVVPDVVVIGRFNGALWQAAETANKNRQSPVRLAALMNRRIDIFNRSPSKNCLLIIV